MDIIDEPDYSSGTETCMVTPQQKTKSGHKSRKSIYQLSEQLKETNSPLSLEKLLDKSLLAELVSEILGWIGSGELWNGTIDTDSS